MTKEENFSVLLEKLEDSKTEEEICLVLKRILKESNSSLYKDVILSNPYFKSLVVDIRNEVLSDIQLIRDALSEEIRSIDDEIIKLLSKDKNDRHIDKFKELKRECISLIYEIDERKRDLISLV